VKRALLVASCLVLLVPAEAGAAKKKPKASLGPVSTVSAVGPVAAPGFVSTATATCPAGTKAIGGGYLAPFGSGASMVVTRSFRSGERSWTAGGISVSGSAATTVEAYCRKTKLVVADVTSAVTLPAVAAATAATAATCPSGWKLVSGGFQGTYTGNGTAFAFPLTSLSASAGVWSVVGINTSASNAQQIVAHAYCVSGIRQPKVLSAVATRILAPAGSPGSATSPKCPKPKKPKKGKKKPPRRRVSGGGFSVPTPPATPIPAVTDSRISGGAWLTAAAAVSGAAGPVPITSQAICS
jgi:hypothetical protein